MLWNKTIHGDYLNMKTWEKQTGSVTGPTWSSCPVFWTWWSCWVAPVGSPCSVLLRTGTGRGFKPKEERRTISQQLGPSRPSALQSEPDSEVKQGSGGQDWGQMSADSLSDQHTHTNTHTVMTANLVTSECDWFFLLSRLSFITWLALASWKELLVS